jgi:hypothetical protein
MNSVRHDIVIVSGLPRSGTSMMMQMLKAGGMAILTDAKRQPDENNPLGYYEFEEVKNIREDSSWLTKCRGKAVKIVSMLLYHLPTNEKYRILFMKREMQEILASQKAMLKSRGIDGADDKDEKLAEKFEHHLIHIEDWLRRQPNVSVLYVKYDEVVEDSMKCAKVVNEFLGGCLGAKEMSRAVKKPLYRQRRGDI